jgi:Flp pilus assembly protein TadB
VWIVLLSSVLIGAAVVVILYEGLHLWQACDARGGELWVRESTAIPGLRRNSLLVNAPASIIRPLIGWVDSAAKSGNMTAVHLLKETDRTLTTAGLQALWDPRIALAYRIASAVGAGGVVLAMALFIWIFASGLGLLMLPLVPVTAWVVFRSTFDKLARQRLLEVERQLPYALEFVSMAMEAHATIDQALAEFVRSVPPGNPLAFEFKLLQRDEALGLGAETAFANFALRSPAPSIRTFASAVKHGLDKGQSMTVVLADQAKATRADRYQSAERIAKDAALQAMLPLMMCAISCFLALLGPLVMNFAM